MNPYRLVSPRGRRTTRQTRSRMRALLEDLERRCLLTVTNLHAVPTFSIVEGTTYGGEALAIFDSNEPLQTDFTATSVGTLPGNPPLEARQLGQIAPGTWEYGVYPVSGFTVGAATAPNLTHAFLFVTDTVDGTDGGTPIEYLITEGALTLNSELSGAGAAEGATFSASGQGLILFTDSAGALSSASDFTSTIDWGDGSPPTVGTITPSVGNPVGTYELHGDHVYAEAGSYTVKATVTDPAFGGSTVTNFFLGQPGATITVGDAPLSSSAQLPIPVNAAEGQLLTGIPIGTFLDANPLATAADFTGSIDWGDSSPADVPTFTPVGITGGKSEWLVTGSHTYFQATGSPFAVTVSVSDEEGSTLAGGLATTATVTQTPLSVLVPALNATAAGAIAPGTNIAILNDAGGLDALTNYSAAISWGDGSTETVPGTDFTPGVGSALDIPTATGHTYAKPGLYPISVVVTDTDPVVGVGNGFALVAPAALTKTADFNGGAPFAATEGIALPSNTQYVTFTYGDPTATASDFTSTIDWGDGTGIQAGTVNLLAPGSFGVTAGHTYAEAGTYTINYTVTDPFGQRITGTGTINVADAALSLGTRVDVTGIEDQNLVNVPVAVFVDANPLATPADIIASIDWGDGSGQIAGTVTKIGAAPNGASIFQVSGTHTYTSSVGSPFMMTVNIADEDTFATNGGVPQIVVRPMATITEGAIDVTVLPITTTSGVPTGTGTPGVPTVSNELIATFIDTTGADALASYSATVDWGDGTTDTGLAVQALGGGQFGVYGTHTYATAGLFRVVVTVNDSDPAVGVGANVAFVLPAAMVIGVTPVPGPVPGVLAPGTEGAPLAPTAGLPIGATGTELATLVVSAPGQPASDYSARIDWGDGLPQSAGQVVPDPIADAADPTHSHFIVTGTHTYLEARTAPYVITVFVTQDLPGGAPFDSDTTVHTTDSVTINDALLTPGIAGPIFGAENQPLNNVLVGTFTDANPFATAADFAATINWGDGTPIDSNAQIHLISGAPAGAVFGVYGSHVYTTLGGNNGVFSTEVTVLDEDSPVGASIAVPPVAANNVTISQSPIIVTALPIEATVNAPTALGTVVATFVDNAGAGSDPLADYSATIDWGDSTPIDVGTIADLGGGQFSVSAPAAGHTYAKIGTYIVKVTVNDTDPAMGIGAALVIVQNSVIVATPTPGPIVNPASGGLYDEGQPLTNVTLATLTDTDTTATAGNYTVQIDWGDGSPQSAGTVIADPVADAADPTHAHFIIQGSHTYAEANPAGYNVQLIVTNATGAKTTASLTIGVADAPLSNATGLPIYATEFQALNDIPVATFVDANPLGSAGDFTATINWGDGSPLDHNARIRLVGANPGGPGLQYAVYGSHVYTAVTPPGSPFLTEITIQDEDGSAIATTPGTVTVSVNASPLVIFPAPLTAVENVPLPNGQTILPQNGANPPTIVATFYDTAGPDPLTAYSAMIDWGNGSGATPDTVTGATILQNGTNFVILAPAGASVAYPEEGSYTIRVALTDANGNITAYAIDPVTVRDGRLTPAAPQPAIPAQSQGVPTGLIPIVSFNDQNPLAPVNDFTATIDWGDGSPQSAGLVTQPGGAGTAFVVSGNHTYAQPSTGAGYTVIVHVVDEGGASITLTQTITVNASVITVTPGHFDAVEGQPLTNVVVATFTDSGGAGSIGSYTASINWNDDTPPTVTPGQIVPLGGNQFEVLGSLPDGYPEEGTYNVFVTITHNGVTVPGSPFTATADVADAPLQGTAVPITATEGTAFTGPVAHFTDLDPNGTPSDYTVTIDWGDGTPTSSGTVTGPTGGPFVVSIGVPGHLYTEEGTYTLFVTVTDHNATFTATEEITVADAPPVPNNPQPTVTVNEGALFSGPVARFQEIYGTFAEPASDFTATIDWGDGTASSTGAIVGTGTPGVYEVVGSHVYANLGNTIGGTPANPTGTFNIIVTIHDDGGTNLTIMNAATVSEVPIVVRGQLDAASDSGKSHNDGITNVNQPTFFGTTEPFADVKLFATPAGGGGPMLIGQTEALSDGSWRIISTRLPDGTYAITATGQDQAGLPIAPAVWPITAATATGSNVLTVDTMGPRVTNAAFDRATGTVSLSFQDFGPSASGLLIQSLVDAANYAFNNQLARPLGRYIIGAINVSPGSGTGEQTVDLSIVSTRFGRPLSSRLLRGFFQIIAHAASVTNPSGIQDVAGNALDGEFYGPGSASGNGVPGGDFVANFNNFHNIVNPPATVIGTPHPNDPAGHFRRTPVRHAVHRVIARHHR